MFLCIEFQGINIEYVRDKVTFNKLITPTINFLQVLHQPSFKVLFIQLINKA